MPAWKGPASVMVSQRSLVFSVPPFSVFTEWLPVSVAELLALNSRARRSGQVASNSVSVVAELCPGPMELSTTVASTRAKAALATALLAWLVPC